MIVRETTLLGLAQLARELGLGVRPTRKLLRRVRFACPPIGDPPRWDARVVDLVRAMREEPHRTLESVHSDWLSRYLEEPHA